MTGKMIRLRVPDVAVLVLCMAVLIFCLGAIGAAGRERAKRAVCLGNLKQLTQAWILYADANGGEIVNGAGGLHFTRKGMTSDGATVELVERAWVGRAWSRNWNNANVADTGLTDEQKKQAIEEGALWPLISDANVYRCPEARPHEFVNYTIVDAMNGLHRLGTTNKGVGHHPDAVGKRVDQTTLWIKNAAEIDTPPAAERMVFVDEGAITPDSFGVHYTEGPWWDDPPVRHNDGATVSWADGHASHIAWRGAETIKFGQRHPDYYGGGGFMPVTEEGLRDLEDFRRAVWGRLGYESTEP